MARKEAQGDILLCLYTIGDKNKNLGACVYFHVRYPELPIDLDVFEWGDFQKA